MRSINRFVSICKCDRDWRGYGWRCFENRFAFNRSLMWWWLDMRNFLSISRWESNTDDLFSHSLQHTLIVSQNNNKTIVFSSKCCCWTTNAFMALRGRKHTSLFYGLFKGKTMSFTLNRKCWSCSTLLLSIALSVREHLKDVQNTNIVQCHLNFSSQQLDLKRNEMKQNAEDK